MLVTIILPGGVPLTTSYEDQDQTTAGSVQAQIAALSAVITDQPAPVIQAAAQALAQTIGSSPT